MIKERIINWQPVTIDWVDKLLYGKYHTTKRPIKSFIPEGNAHERLLFEINKNESNK